MGYTLRKLLETRPWLISTALLLSPQISTLHSDGWMLLMLALLHSAHTPAHSDVIITTYLLEHLPLNTRQSKQTE